MQYFDLVFDECKKLNIALESTFKCDDLFFVSANISEIIFGLRNNAILFGYYPERYEYGKTMLLKDVFVRIDFDKQRQYSVNELNSFIKSEFKDCHTSSSYKTIEEQLTSLNILLEFMNSSAVNWEEKFVSYKKNNSFEW